MTAKNRLAFIVFPAAAAVVTALARLLAPVWLKLSGSGLEKPMTHGPVPAMLVISATAVAVCTELVPCAPTPTPVPAFCTRNRIKSPTLRPPGARMFVGRAALGTATSVAVAVVEARRSKSEREVAQREIVVGIDGRNAVIHCGRGAGNNVPLPLRHCQSRG